MTPFLNDGLWPAFQELNKVPVDDLSEITDRIIRREVFLARVEAEEVDATPEHAPERGGLAGRVERVTFHNEGTGFRVPRVEARGHRDEVTVVGQAAAGAGAGDDVMDLSLCGVAFLWESSPASEPHEKVRGGKDP